MILLRYIRDFFYFIPIAFVGWFKVIISFHLYLYSRWSKNSLLLKVSLIVFLSQFLFATRPWFEYQIRFNDVDEVLSVSSKVNLVFILMSLVNFILLLQEFSFSIYMILILQLIMGILFFVGYQSPTTLHVDFVNSSDYKFNTNFYIFSAAFLFALVISIFNFLKNKKEIKTP